MLQFKAWFVLRVWSSFSRFFKQAVLCFMSSLMLPLQLSLELIKRKWNLFVIHHVDTLRQSWDKRCHLRKWNLDPKQLTTKTEGKWNRTLIHQKRRFILLINHEMCVGISFDERLHLRKLTFIGTNVISFLCTTIDSIEYPIRNEEIR